MSKKAPSTTQLVVIAAFALSCFGILLFLWITFGGPTPFKAKPYELKVPFNEATQLAQQSDVRISGVSVGKVQDIEEAPNGQQALATLYINDKYGPLPRGTRAILRTKTLLGETYVELTPGEEQAPKLQDGAQLPQADVAESAQLDELFRTFNPRTRSAFQEWMQNAAIAIQGRGQDFSAAFAQFEPTFSEFDRLFRVLDSQRLAVNRLFRNGAVTFRALRGRQGELAALVRASDTVFRTTAARERDLEALFRAFPTFEDESRATLERLKGFALNADPLMRQLVPAARQLSPTLIAFAKLAPQAKGFFEGFATVIERSGTAFPALRKIFRDEFPPLLRAVDPFLRNLNPILVGLGLYKRDLAGTIGNVAAITHAIHLGNTGEQLHYVRAMGPLTPESLATYMRRLSSNRADAYPQPGSDLHLGEGLQSFETRQCSAGATATLPPEAYKAPSFLERAEGDEEKAKKLFELLKHFAMSDQESSATVPAPKCEQQPPFQPIYGSEPPTAYQHTYEQSQP
jgi:phospholipid/cholesterol/gamma-HCH transport system substrate-binding protein